MFVLLLLIFFISLLILVHEWGHFYSARKFGVKVEEFGFGFPPRLFSLVKNGTRYSFNLLPFGGFVRIFGEHGEGEGSKESFISRPAGQRFLILASGIIMNLVLAWIFFSIASTFGIPHLSGEVPPGTPVSIIGIAPDSPADIAGLRPGDQILEMKSEEISLKIVKEADIQEFVEAYRGEEIILVIKRGQKIIEIASTPRLTYPEGEGPLGIMLARISVLKVPLWLAPLEGAKTLIRATAVMITGLGRLVKDLVTGHKISVEVSGPVGIFFFARDTWTLGMSYFLQFIGALSTSLAVLNFLPIPALDGGRILFLGIEKLRRRKLNPRVENLIHTLGFALLILLMILVTYRDIARIF